MDITLKYTFTKNGECMDSYQPHGAIEPSTHYGTYEVVFDYNADVTHDMVLEFMISLIGRTTYNKWSKEKQQGFVSCFDLLWGEEVFSEDYFLMSDDFYDFAKDYCEEDARDEFDNLDY